MKKHINELIHANQNHLQSPDVFGASVSSQGAPLPTSSHRWQQSGRCAHLSGSPRRQGRTPPVMWMLVYKPSKYRYINHKPQVLTL